MCGEHFLLVCEFDIFIFNEYRELKRNFFLEMSSCKV